MGTILQCSRCRFPSNRIVGLSTNFAVVALISASSSNSDDDDRNKEFKKATGLIYFVSKTNVHHTSWYISLLTSHLRATSISSKVPTESLVLTLRLLLQVKVCSFRKSLNKLIKTLYYCSGEDLFQCQV